MRKSCCILLALLILLSGVNSFAYTTDVPVNFVLNGNSVNFRFKPIIRDGVTYVGLQEIASKLSLSYTAFPDHDSVIVSNGKKSICFVPYDEHATVADLTGTTDSEYHYYILAAPCIYIDNTLVVAVRDIATVFGQALKFDPISNTVYLGYSQDMISDNVLQSAQAKTYYFQNQADFELPSYGSGYCWACSYAMLISNVVGYEVTPNDVAEINSSNGSSGAYCHHSQIATAFGVRFVSALSEKSPYYRGRDFSSGGTYIENPTKDDAITIAAMKEALDLHPEGIMVRYADFPHTMVAVAYDGDIILFNDPAPSSSGTYSSVGRYHAVPFSETCVARKGFSISDVTFIQALSK